MKMKKMNKLIKNQKNISLAEKKEIANKILTNKKANNIALKGAIKQKKYDLAMRLCFNYLQLNGKLKGWSQH